MTLQYLLFVSFEFRSFLFVLSPMSHGLLLLQLVKASYAWRYSFALGSVFRRGRSHSLYLHFHYHRCNVAISESRIHAGLIR